MGCVVGKGVWCFVVVVMWWWWCVVMWFFVVVCVERWCGIGGWGHGDAVVFCVVVVHVMCRGGVVCRGGGACGCVEGGIA